MQGGIQLTRVGGGGIRHAHNRTIWHGKCGRSQERRYRAGHGIARRECVSDLGLLLRIEQPDISAWRIVTIGRSGRALRRHAVRRCAVRDGGGFGPHRHAGAAQGDLDIGGGDHARSQNHGVGAGEVDHGAFDAHRTRSAVQYQLHAIAQRGLHVLRRGRTDLREPVRAGSGDRHASGSEQGQRHRMRRHPEGDRIEPCGGHVGHLRGLRQHQRQWARPEGGGQAVGGGGPLSREGTGRRDIRGMDDDGVPRRATLGGVNAGDRDRVERVGAESVHGFGGKGDESPTAQQGGRVRDDHGVGITGVEPEKRSTGHAGI